MDTEDRVYVELQKHLDRHPVGFPATRSKAEIQLYDIIMANRKGALGRLGVVGKFLLDAIRTGQIRLLKL